MDLTWLAELASEFGGSGDLRTAVSPSGAVIAYAGPVVIKVHHVRTDPTLLLARLRLAADLSPADVLAAPISIAVHRTPDGRSATVWPRLEVLHPTDRPPWASAGTLLARLHLVDRGPIASLPPLRPVARLERALGRVPPSAPVAPLLLGVGSAVVREAVSAPADRRLVHGDWHLGQLGRPPGREWQLLDVDDIGGGDPVWDLGRPAGFWAAGLLSDPEWDAFLVAYRSAGGPAVPADGDPWGHLDLPARAAVVTAACRAVSRPDADEQAIAEALFEVCRRM